MKKLIMFFSILFLGSLFTLAQQEWHYINPKPNNGSYKAASFTDNNNGTIVGAKGIIRTKDGGVSWKWQIFNKPRQLYSVSFVDANNGWAVGPSGTIISTTDAGETWIEQISGTTETLNSVHFINSNNGIAVGSSGTVRRTTNGGNTWSTLNIVNTYVVLFGVYFSDINNITIVGSAGTILRSSDGGNAWGSQSAGTTTSFKAVHFVDENVGTIVGGGGTIRRTIDGGSNWIVQSAGTASQFESVSFIDANNGIIVGPQNTYYKTSDGGNNWNSNSVDISGGLAAVYIDANNAFIVGHNEILETKNGGSDWTNHYKLEDEYNFNSRIGALHIFDENSFATINNFAGQYRFFRTSDNGENWSSYFFGSGTSGEILDMHFEGEYFGVLCGTAGRIFVTYDGGSSWTSKSISSLITLRSISFGSSVSGTLVGSGGNIYRTTDAGQTWFNQTSGTTNSLNSVYFVNETVGTAVGANSTILRTTDGGSHWLIQSSPIPSITFYDISFIDEENGIIVGSNGNILRTTDGGINWISSNIGYPMSVLAITQTDLNHATIIGNITTGSLFGSGYIFSTTDAGNSWVMQRFTGASLTDISSLSNSNIITVGVDGRILKGREVFVPINSPPSFISPTPTCGTPFTIDVGQPFNFTVAAEDIDVGDVVILTASGLPLGSMFVEPTPINPVSSDFSWTPDLASVGNHTLTFEITDGVSTPVSCSFNIEVVNNNVAPVFVAPTPVCGTSLTATVGTVLNFTVAAEDVDAGDVVELTASGLPSGSTMNPVLPFSGNPVSSDFTWTPTSSDIGSHEIIYTATDNLTASVSCTLTVDVEGVPAVVCPLNQLYWEANPSTWPVSSMVLGTVNNYTDTELLSLLGSTIRSDASIILAKQLIAAKLNAANGAPVPTAVANAITNADNTIGSLFIPAETRPISRTGIVMLLQAIYLWSYNNNFLTPDCASTLSKQMANEEEITTPVNEYTLFDNYPNPFNPTTRIVYTVSENEFVSLKVYNTVGEEVMILVNEVKQPGLYEVDFNAASLPSGVYMYRIIAGEFVQTKKMILMK